MHGIKIPALLGDMRYLSYPLRNQCQAPCKLKVRACIGPTQFKTRAYEGIKASANFCGDHN
jgi:hypothetical protein